MKRISLVLLFLRLSIQTRARERALNIPSWKQSIRYPNNESTSDEFRRGASDTEREEGRTVGGYTTGTSLSLAPARPASGSATDSPGADAFPIVALRTDLLGQRTPSRTRPNPSRREETAQADLLALPPIESLQSIGTDKSRARGGGKWDRWGRNIASDGGGRVGTGFGGGATGILAVLGLCSASLLPLPAGSDRMGHREDRERAGKSRIMSLEETLRRRRFRISDRRETSIMFDCTLYNFIFHPVLHHGFHIFYLSAILGLRGSRSERR